MGLLASTLLDYGGRFEDPTLGLLMRQIDSPWVMAGPLFQPLRGLLSGMVFLLRRLHRIGATLATVGSLTEPAHALYASAGFTDSDVSGAWIKEE